jgi:hypothetical protein
MNEEGWYIDPFGHHGARWFSDGIPTALVRDGGLEGHDPPPSSPITGNLERVAETPPTDGSDLKRADDAEAGEFDPSAMTQAASDAIDSATGL